MLDHKEMATNKNLLKRLVEQLVLEGYLLVGDYQVLKLGNITGLKNPEIKVLVKISDEDKLSEIHGRTTGAIRARLKKLKLIEV